LGIPRFLLPTFSHAATASHARQAFIRSAQFSAFRCFGLPNRFEKTVLRRVASERAIQQRRPQPVFAGTELVASKPPLMDYSPGTVPRMRLMTAVPKIRFALGLGRGLVAYAVT